MIGAKEISTFSLLLSKFPRSLNRYLGWVEIILADCNIKSFPYSYPYPILIDSMSKVWVFERHIECLVLCVFSSMRKF